MCRKRKREEEKKRRIIASEDGQVVAIEGLLDPIFFWDIVINVNIEILNILKKLCVYFELIYSFFLY